MRTTSVGAGDHVADRRLVGLLGSGGEGEVWEAVRPDGSRCALKLVRPEVLPAPDEVRRRGQWLVRIDHPALVRVSRGGRFTGGELAGWGFVEMDLVEGPSLQSVPPLRDALPRLEGVAEALDLLHAGTWSDGVPLVHRDVKPGNLIGSGGGLVLVDPSTMRGLDTRDLTRVGTPAYLAPEVATGRFGPLIDVYSLAATAVALLTGARGSALGPIIAEPWDHGLPEAVCAALDPDPARRPGTCAAVVDGRPVVAVPHGSHPHDVPGSHDVPGHDIRRDVHGDVAHGDRLDTAPVPGGPGWTVGALALITLAPAITWALRQSRPSLVSADLVTYVLVGTALVHLTVHLATRRAALALFAPPWAWGNLIAGRRGWPPPASKRTTWLADVVTGTILLAGAAVAAVVGLASPPVAVPAIVLAAIVLIVLWRRLARVTRRVAWAPVWTLTLPIRLLAAVPRVLVGGGDR